MHVHRSGHHQTQLVEWGEGVGWLGQLKWDLLLQGLLEE